MEPSDIAKLLCEEELLLEQIQIPYAQFASGDFRPMEVQAEPRSATIPPNKVVLDFPQIGPNVYLPMFSTDMSDRDWRKIMGYMRLQSEQGNPVDVEGFGGFEHLGQIYPGSDENIAAGNAQMLRDIQYHNQINTVIASKLDGHDLIEVAAMPVPARAADIPTNEPNWQRLVREKVQELKDDNVITSVHENLPGTWEHYQAIEAQLRPNRVILYSPRDGRGFYVMSDSIELYQPNPDGEPQPSGQNVTWYRFLDMFSRARDDQGNPDPSRVLRDAGFDTSDMTESGAARQRLSVRRYLEATGQGRYVARSMRGFPQVLEQWAYGEEAKGFGEDIEKLFTLLCESDWTPSAIAVRIDPDDPDIR
jgi:hypothetical protein